MSKKEPVDRISLGIVATQFLLFISILIPTVLQVERQELLVEFRYNFIKNYVEKVEWYWLYLPALIALCIIIVNLLIVKYMSSNIDKMIIRTYLVTSLVALLILVIVTLSMQSAIGL